GRGRVTVIVGYRVEGGVLMASDSHTIGCDAVLRTLEPKLQRLADDLVVGSSGWSRHSQILVHSTEPPTAEPGADLKDALLDWVPTLKRSLSRHGWLKKDDEGHDSGYNSV